jgi:hypothetical protein
MAKQHPGITMHKISFGGGFIGLLFAGGSALIFLLGFPTLWYFVAFAFGLGIAIAVFLRLISQRRADRNTPLSILAVPKQRSPLVFRRREKFPDRFRAEATPANA